MELKEAIYGRRAVRKYNDIPISEEEINDIVKAGLMAPSGMNMQPWYFVFIKDPAVLAEVREKMTEGSKNFVPLLEKRFPTYPEVVKETTTFIASLGNAPLVMLAFIRKPDYDKSPSTLIQSVSAAIQNMLLAAYEKGIGSCWLTAPNEVNATVWLKERFAPDKGDFVAMVTFGHYDMELKAPRRHEDRVEII